MGWGKKEGRFEWRREKMRGKEGRRGNLSGVEGKVGERMRKKRGD